MSSAIQAVLKTAPRRATLKKIRNLASQKPVPVEFTSSNAYIIMGHGQDSDRMIKVPENCMVVVKYRPGETGYSADIFPLWNTVGAPENIEIYRNPLNHIPEIINQLGDVLIYKPGDRCPNFRYTFVWNEDNFILDETASHWGLIKAPLQTPVELIPNEEDTEIISFFAQLYKESILFKGKNNIYANTLIKLLKIGENPTVNDCFKLLMNVASNPSKYVESPFKQFKVSFTMTQEQLFGINSEGIARRPGVYYNFVCRGVPNITYDINTTITNSNFLFRTPKNVRGLLEKRIGEAETKRKQLLRGTKYNIPSARKTRRRRN